MKEVTQVRYSRGWSPNWPVARGSFHLTQTLLCTCQKVGYVIVNNLVMLCLQV